MPSTKGLWLSILGVLLALALGFSYVESSTGGIARTLEDTTGEWEFRHQLEALVLLALQRPLDTADMAPVKYAGVNPYGVNTFFEQEVEEWKLRKAMEMLREAGVRWIHQQVPWWDIETPAKGEYVDEFGQSTWDKYDRIFDLAQEYSLEVIARLDDPPNWSRQDNLVHNRPPDNLDDFGDFVYTFASRYRGKIKYYQFWNEPNVFPEWGAQEVDAAGYVQLLKVAYTRAREADPDAVILSAPLSQTLGTYDGWNESDLTYLQKMYDAGAKNYFDILATQAHGLWTGPGDRRAEPGRTNFSRLALIREVMVRNGDASKAVWVAETGWDAVPPDFPKPATHGRVTDEQQARYTIAAYRRAQQEWPWVGTLSYWFFRRVSDADRENEDFYYRMVDPDFTPRPVYEAFKAMANEPPVLYRGYHQEYHWSLDYSGPWQEQRDSQAVNGAFKVSDTSGASLGFRFQGTDLTVVAARPGGRAYVKVDGSPYKANQLPVDERGRAYLDLSGSEAWQVRFPVTRGLPAGEHSVSIEVAGGEPVIIDALIVDSDGSETVRTVLAVFLLIGVALSVFLAFQAYRR